MRSATIVLFVLLSTVASAQSFTTRGTEFWTGFMENRADIGNRPARFGFLISAPRATSVEIVIPGTEFWMSVDVKADSVTSILLPADVASALGSDSVEAKGILIYAQDSIQLYAMNYRIHFSDGTIVLPVGQLGSSYVAIAADDYERISASSLLVVASEDNTELEITPSADTRSLRPAGVPYTVTLDQGDVYQIQAMENLSGTIVRSTNGKRFALYGGAQAAGIVCRADSHIYDQLFPLEQWGNEYLAVPFDQRKDQLRIVASEDSTEVSFDCGDSVMLARGESYIHDITIPTRVTATRPIGIVQLARGAWCAKAIPGPPGIGGDPTMQTLAPTSQRLFRSRFHSPAYMPGNLPDYPTFDTHFLTLIAAADDTAGLRLDGQPVGARLAPFPSDAHYLWASIPLSAGDHLLEAPNGVIAYAYGWGYYDGYSYSLGADTLMIETDDPLAFEYSAGIRSLLINGCDTIRANQKLCSGGTFTFRASDDPTVGQWNWSFGDGYSAIGREVVHTFDTAGEYLVRLSTAGAGCTVREVGRHVRVDECDDTTAASALIVSPNPAKRVLSIIALARRSSIFTIELFSASGESLGFLSSEALEPGIHRRELDMGERPSGVYFLRASFGEEIVFEKFIRTE